MVGALGVTGGVTSLAAYAEGGRGVLIVLGFALLILMPIGAYIQWQDFRAGVMRHGPGLRWQVTREAQPIRFWVVSIVGLLCLPLGVAMLAVIFWSVWWGS